MPSISEDSESAWTVEAVSCSAYLSSLMTFSDRSTFPCIDAGISITSCLLFERIAGFLNKNNLLWWDYLFFLWLELMNLIPFKAYSHQLLLCLDTSVWAFYEPPEKCYGRLYPLVPACKLHCLSSCSRRLNEFKTRAKLKLFPCPFKCSHLGLWSFSDVFKITESQNGRDWKGPLEVI